MHTSHSPLPVRSLLAVAILLVAAACNGGGGAGAATVEIRDNTYLPATAEISAGDSVTWTNEDDVPHTVTFTDGDVAGSDELGEGESFTAEFTEPGTYSYVCTLHPEMEATVTVSG